MTLAGCYLLLASLGKSSPETIDIQVIESPKVSVAAPAPPPTLAPQAQPKPQVLNRKVFGVTKKSIVDEGTSSSNVEVKQGNTLATTPDNEKLKDGDADSLPIPTDEYLVDRMPSLLSEVRIPYPKEAREKGIAGTVVMELLIDANGKVREVRLVNGPGFGLNEAAVAAVWSFRFSPAQAGGQAVAVRTSYRYNFVLEK